MANKKHSELVDPNEIHVPKGFIEADTSTALVKNEIGELEYRALNVLGEVGPKGDPGLDGRPIKNKLIVQKDPGEEQFLTIQGAINSISDANEDNRYLVSVGPGIYEENIIMKPFVDVIGTSNHSTIIRSPDPSLNTVTGSARCKIASVKIEGATGIGSSGIKFTAQNNNDIFFANDIKFGSNHRLTFVEADSVIGEMRLTGVEVDAEAVFHIGFEVADGSELTILRIANASIAKFTPPYPHHLFEVKGNNALLFAVNVIARMEGGDVHGLHLEDGCEAKVFNMSLRGFGIGVHAENIGAGPKFKCLGLLLDDCTLDIQIEHPGSTGFLEGSFSKEKTFINPDAHIKLTYTEPNPDEDAGLVTLGSFFQGDRHDRLINLSKLGRAAATMGLFSGGVISEAGGLNVSISAGEGFLLDPDERFVKEIQWGNTTLTVPSSNSIYIFVNANGIVSQAGSLPNPVENIILGSLSTMEGIIQFIQATPFDLNQTGNKLELLTRNALGPIYQSGSLVSENSIVNRGINVTAGTYWYGTNIFEPSGGDAIEFTTVYRDGGSGYNTITGINQVTNSEYDDSSGTLASLDAGKYVKHALYIVGGPFEKYFLVIGQQQFDTIVDAEGGDIPAPPSVFIESITLIATITTQQGQSNIQLIQDARPVIGFRAPGVGTTADHSNLIGLNADDHPQYLRADGARSMSGNLNMGSNNITNVSLVDGVDVSTHASRHLPNGADALTTAAPVTSNADGSNNEGNANALARSNHKHNIATAGPISLNADGNNNEGTSASLARADHKHDINTGGPVSVSDSSNIEGTSSNLARADHIHAHGNRGGGALHSAVSQSNNGFMIASDKTKLDQMALGHLQYSNSTVITTTSITGIALNLDTDRSSFPNGFLNKVSGTQIRSDFNGQVRITFKIHAFPDGNDRGYAVFIRRNANDEVWTESRQWAKNRTDRASTVTGEFIMDCVVNDLFEIRLRSQEGDIITVPANLGLAKIEVYRIAL
jgi:hypothetical protein